MSIGDVRSSGDEYAFARPVDCSHSRPSALGRPWPPKGRRPTAAMRSIAVGADSNDRCVTHLCPWSPTTGRRWTTLSCHWAARNAGGRADVGDRSWRPFESMVWPAALLRLQSTVVAPSTHACDRISLKSSVVAMLSRDAASWGRRSSTHAGATQARTLVYEPLWALRRDAQALLIEPVAIDVISSRRRSRVL